MSIMDWNCLGLGHPRAVPILLDLVGRYSPSLVFLSETLVSKSQVDVVCRRLGYDCMFVVDSSGRSGGLCMFWKSILMCSVFSYFAHHISLIVKVNQHDWRVTGFYGFPDRAQRGESWDLLRRLKDESDLPWIILGDFNDLLDQQEKQGAHIHWEWCINGFRNTINECNLVNIPLSGYQFTWSRHKEKPAQVLEQLDKAFASKEWFDIYPNCLLKKLLAPISDHSPIFLVFDYGFSSPLSTKRNFRFENKWIMEDNFDSLVMSIWVQSSGHLLPHRHNLLAKKLQVWGKTLYHSQNFEHDKCYQDLLELQNSSTPQDIERFLDTRKPLVSILLKDEEFWRQRAKLH